MRTATKAVLLTIVLVTTVRSGEAAAQMVAGWDFSQYIGEPLLSIDENLTPIAALPANYSHFDPTFNAGAESAAFGTFHYDGNFGSTAVSIDFSGSELLQPVTGSLASNLTAPVDIPNGQFNEFDSFTILIEEGQAFAGKYKMLAQGPVSVVFRADLSSIGEVGTGWRVSFAGQTLRGPNAPPDGTGPVTMAVDFAPDCGGYSTVANVVLDGNDRPFEVPLGPGPATSGCVRFTLAPENDFVPVFDNVAIFVPEPSAGAGAIGALVAVAGLTQRERRRRRPLAR